MKRRNNPKLPRSAVLLLCLSNTQPILIFKEWVNKTHRFSTTCSSIHCEGTFAERLVPVLAYIIAAITSRSLISLSFLSLSSLKTDSMRHWLWSVPYMLYKLHPHFSASYSLCGCQGCVALEFCRFWFGLSILVLTGFRLWFDNG